MLKIYLSQINTAVGDLAGNAQKILTEFYKAEAAKADLALFCEMTITGYPAQDLWQKKYFLEEVQEKLREIMLATKSAKCAILVGAPYVSLNRAKKEVVSNAVFLIEKGEIISIIRKKTLPNYGVFDERRYFEPDSALSFVEFRNQTLAILLCEDIWDSKNIYLLQEQVFDSIISLNASPYQANKHLLRAQVVQNVVQKVKKPVIYLNQVGAQDSLVFDGSSFVVNEKGETVLALSQFAPDSAVIELQKGSIAKEKISTPLFAAINNSNDNDLALEPLSQNGLDKQNNSYEISRNYSACILGLRDYIEKNNFKKVLLGMSGGIDSALVAAIAVDALGAENVALYALPSRFNSTESMRDAQECAANLGLQLQIISIENTFNAMLQTLENQGLTALAQENLQSRIRGNILMALSNSTGALLLSTGNKSELATGYATLYGDMCGAFNPIKDVYKTQIYQLANWRNSKAPEISSYKKTALIPQNIITKEPTAELRANQKDSDLLPDYAMLDQILYAIIEQQKSVAEVIKKGFDEAVVKKVAKLFYSSEYKRKQAVIGPKISSMSFDLERRYPITNKFWQ